MIYKVKINDDMSLKLKAGIAPHGNEDSAKSLLQFDCAMCPPAGFKIAPSIAALQKFRLKKINVKTVFLQAGLVERDVYVIPACESEDRSKRM